MKKLLLLLAALVLCSGVTYAESTRTRANQLEEWLTESDITAEIEFGREVAARIIGTYTLYKNDKLTKYLNLVAKSLARHSNRPELSFTVGILNTEIINGFSAPGGYIFLTKGAVDAMENEAELAGVLAHEMIHITQKHIVKELKIKGSDTSAVAGMGRLVGGATDAVRMAFFTAVDEATKILFERGYKVQDELEADAMGTALAASMNYDPTALIDYFNKIKAGEKEETASIKKLHPSFDKRIDLINTSLKNEGLTPGNYKKGRSRFDEYTKR